jgi:Cu-Zn family superoxide dismutase
MRANDLNKCPRTKETQCQCESLHTINEAEETVKALVKFEHTEGDVQGIIKMKQDPGKPTIIRGLIKGLEPGEHGFHIHEFGDLSDGCASAGGHYNPDGVDHGDIDNGHVGDLGNITANEKGEARFKIVARRVDLSGDRSVVGRAVVVHADRDDLGKGGDEESLKTGNAGDRLGCGVIRLRQGIEEDYQRHVSDKHFNRNELPQIRKSDIKDSPFNFKQGTITLDKIKPVQSQRVDGLSKRAENMFFDGDYRPFILDKKGYLVNGHHRFDAANILGIDKVKAIIVDADIEELMKHFSHKVSDQAVMDSLQNKLTTMLTSEDASNCKHGKYFCSTDKVWKCRKKPKKKRVTEDMKSVLKKALDDLKKGAKEYKKAHDKKAEYNPLAHSKGSVFDPDRYKKPLPKEVDEFVDTLVPTDVGRDTVGDYIVHYEGFTDECNDGHDDNSIDDVYADVYRDFDSRQGQKALIRGVANDELGCGNNPVLYSVYKNVNEGDVVDFPGTYFKKEYVDVNGVKMLKDVWEYMSQEREEEHSIDSKGNRFKKGISNFTGDEHPVILKKAYQMELRNFIDEFENNDMDPQPFIDELEQLDERNLNPAVKDYVKGKNTKLIKVKVADLDDEAIDDRFGRVIDPDPDVGVDLDKPILIDIDGKTILDGFHRVYQAKRVGRDVIPAEIIDENFADGKKKGKSRPGRVKKAGASCKGSVSSLRAKAKKYSGEKGKMYHWCANMKAGKKKG